MDGTVLLVIGIVLATAGAFLGAFSADAIKRVAAFLPDSVGERFAAAVPPRAVVVVACVLAGIGIVILLWGVFTS